MNAKADPALSVDLVFDGQVLAGFDPEQVKRAIGDFFKLDEQRRDRMFSGAPQVIKRGLAPEEASRYIALFEKLGGRLHPRNNAAPADPGASGPAAVHVRQAPARPATAQAPAPAPEPAPAVAPAAPQLALMPTPERAPAVDAGERRRAARTTPDTAPPSRHSALPAETMVVMDAPPSVFGVGLSGRLARRPNGAAALFGWAAMRWGLMGLAHHPHRGVAVLIGLGMLVAALWTFRLTLLRLHDIGISGWWVLLGLVPIVGTLAGILLSLVPGSTGDNRFGAEPDPGSRVLRMLVVVAVLCIGAGFRHGLLPGGGAGDLETTAPGATQADGPAPAPTDDELSGVLKSAKARNEFRDAYWPAKGHKAFAASDSGAWGWSSDAGTADAAKADALAQCEKLRDVYSSECRPLNVDGEWAE